MLVDACGRAACKLRRREREGERARHQYVPEPMHNTAATIVAGYACIPRAGKNHGVRDSCRTSEPKCAERSRNGPILLSWVVANHGQTRPVRQEKSSGQENKAWQMEQREQT